MKQFVLLAAIFALTGVHQAKAESKLAQNPILKGRFNVYLGGFFPRISDEIRLDADIDGGIGTNIHRRKYSGWTTAPPPHGGTQLAHIQTQQSGIRILPTQSIGDGRCGHSTLPGGELPD